jgi:GT2 family glycosyltransferase
LIKILAVDLMRWVNYSVKYELNCLPGTEVEYDDDRSLVWMTGDVHISLMPNTKIKIAGYYMLELTVSDVSKPLSCCLYSGGADDFSEENSMRFTIPAAGADTKIIKRVCYFNDAAGILTLDLGEEAGRCKNLSVRLVKLSQSKAKYFMDKKWTANSCFPLLSSSLPELYKKYDGLFQQPLSNSYHHWMAANEGVEILSDDLVNSLIKRPLISIVCPTYNTKSEWLIACIESVKNQSYSNWQLILVDDASSEQSHFEWLKKYSQKDPRIQVIFLEINGHISAATNAGIDLALGEYTTFLDHDDELAPNALAEICSVINANPDVKVIYSDEDLMSEAGERIAPHFKSDWNIELLRAHNYVTHLCCYEVELLSRLGGMRLGYEGAQDYDLILRASAKVEPKQIHHISKVLYHWRMVEGSTALSSGAKSYATDAGLEALKDHMLNVDIGAKVDHTDRDNFYRVTYSLPSVLPKVSIIIPTRDGMDVLRPCIETLLNTTIYANYEVIILDNGSVEKETLNYLSILKNKPNFTIVRDDGEFNYSRINNYAVTYATGDLICLLNNDIEIIQPDWLSEMVSIAIRKEVGCVGAKLLYPDGTIQHAGVILGLGGYAAHSHRGIGGNEAGYFCRAQVRQQLSAVTGACLLIKREIYDAVGGLDEAFQVAYNDVDFCLRVQALGYQNIYTPFAELIHYESKTRGEDTSVEKIKRFDKEKSLLSERWGAQLNNDRFYNINLTRSREDFSI